MRFSTRSINHGQFRGFLTTTISDKDIYLLLTAGQLLQTHGYRLQRFLHTMYIVTVIILWCLVEEGSRVISLVRSDQQILAYMCVCVTISSWVISIYLQSVLPIHW